MNWAMFSSQTQGSESEFWADAQIRDSFERSAGEPLSTSAIARAAVAQEIHHALDHPVGGLERNHALPLDEHAPQHDLPTRLSGGALLAITTPLEDAIQALRIGALGFNGIPAFGGLPVVALSPLYQVAESTCCCVKEFSYPSSVREVDEPYHSGGNGEKGRNLGIEFEAEAEFSENEIRDGQICQCRCCEFRQKVDHTSIVTGPGTGPRGKWTIWPDGEDGAFVLRGPEQEDGRPGQEQEGGVKLPDFRDILARYSKTKDGVEQARKGSDRQIKWLFHDLYGGSDLVLYATYGYRWGYQDLGGLKDEAKFRKSEIGKNLSYWKAGLPTPRRILSNGYFADAKSMREFANAMRELSIIEGEVGTKHPRRAAAHDKVTQTSDAKANNAEGCHFWMQDKTTTTVRAGQSVGRVSIFTGQIIDTCNNDTIEREAQFMIGITGSVSDKGDKAEDVSYSAAWAPEGASAGFADDFSFGMLFGRLTGFTNVSIDWPRP